MKDIKGFENSYKISMSGEIWSKNKQRFLNPYKPKTCNYLMIDLYLNGKRYKRLIHRLVAEHYVPNPQHKPEVDHKDNNTFNNSFDNLQWVTRKENIDKSYNTMSQIRNFKNCELYKGNELIGKFKSINEASKYSKDVFGLSYSSMNKYRKYKDYYIIKV